MKLLIGLLKAEEYEVDANNLNDVLSRKTYGSPIYYLSPEKYDAFKNMNVVERVNAYTEDNSVFREKRIGLHCKQLIGCPLILHNREDEYKTRSFTFAFKNDALGIKHNACEVIDNYPDFFNTRDVAKYTVDDPIFIDTNFEGIVKSLLTQTYKIYHVVHQGHGAFAMFDTPEQREKSYKYAMKLLHGNVELVGHSREPITKTQAYQMLEEVSNKEQ